MFLALAPGRTAKQFAAYCPVAKWTAAKAFRRATAKAASLFLDKVLAEMPFSVQAIQVDSGIGVQGRARDRLPGQADPAL